MQMSNRVVCLCLMISFQAVKSAPPAQRDFSEEESHKANSRPHVSPTRRPDKSGGSCSAAGRGDPGRKLLNERRRLR